MGSVWLPEKDVVVGELEEGAGGEVKEYAIAGLIERLLSLREVVPGTSNPPLVLGVGVVFTLSCRRTFKGRSSKLLRFDKDLLDRSDGMLSVSERGTGEEVDRRWSWRGADNVVPETDPEGGVLARGSEGDAGRGSIIVE